MTQVGRRLGAGSFGEIFSGVGVGPHVSPANVAIKFEPISARHRQLLVEAKCYKLMHRHTGFSSVHWFGQTGNFSVLVMDRLGRSLEEYFKSCQGRFSITTAATIAQQMLTRIERLHSKGVIHRDIKPDNFLMAGAVVYMIDFGLAKRFKSSRGVHIGFQTGLTLTGTARYASLNAHQGYEQSRRDDLESALMCLVYFIKGRLPWQQLTAATKSAKYDLIRELKRTVTTESLCEGLPVEIATAVNYVRSLSFSERPSYAFLRGLLSSMVAKMGEVPR